MRWLTVLGACAFAFWLRCAFGYSVVFQPDGFVNFQDTDAWYHYRVIENLLAHFPWRITFDPYAVYPDGQNPRFAGLYDLGVGFVAWALGAGTPSAELAKATAAWSPAAMAALVPAAVYLLARTLFAPGAAIAAAWLIAVLPGNWLKVSRLGFADHHVAEVLFSTLALWALLRSFERSRLAAAGAGLALGAYLAAWAPGALLAAVIVAWTALYALIRRFGDEDARPVVERVLITLAVAWLFFLPFGWHRWSIYTHVALGGGILGLAGLQALGDFLRRKGAPPWALPAVLSAGLAAAIAAAVLLDPPWFAAFRSELARFQPTDRQQTLGELRPILYFYGPFQLRAVWEQFGFSWLLALPAFVALLWRRRGGLSPARSLFLFWTAFFLAMTVSQIRTAYYLAVCFAVLAGAAAWKLYQASPRRVRPLTASALLLFLYGANLGPALEIVRSDSGVSPELRQALEWLSRSTPEPFGDPKKRLALYGDGMRAGEFDYPDSVYTVLCWWDLGHQVNAIAGRIPTANGFQTGGFHSARFYLATSEAEALPIARELRARYLLLEPGIPVWSFGSLTPTGSKFLAFPLWSHGEKRLEQYLEVYVRRTDDGRDEPVVVFYPDYYRSMMARLYLFDGRAVEPVDSVWALAWKPETGPDGEMRRRITSQRRFRTYEEAHRYIEVRPDQPLVLAGLDPARSCVPLGALESFREAYSTNPGPLGGETGRVTAVKVFERLR
ncbi:MAG: hypothetical protein GC160_07065 [Acidobacteria bacterium]|nr:hypothetical protein [Acidobacteriota bacterium]